MRPERHPRAAPFLAVGASAPSDAALLDLVQRRTFRFFWDFAHPVCGLARDRLDKRGQGGDLVAIGGSGFGVMAIIVAVARGWVGRDEALARMQKILRHLAEVPRYHGVFPHFIDGRTGATVPFVAKDDGGDIVETAFLFQGLLSARQYFSRDTAAEASLREMVDRLWRSVEWNWHTRGGRPVLYWHWSPNHGWARDHQIRGWNECLIAYVLAAASPDHAIDTEAYHRGWAAGPDFVNGQRYYGLELPLGPAYGGPLCFAHYSFLGLSPAGLVDRYADYWQQNVRHAQIHYRHSVKNPNGHPGYGPQCWGLTASDGPRGYDVHAPDHDPGVIAPTAALSSMPYVPAESIAALRHFLALGDRIWGECGFTSAFCPRGSWASDDSIAIDQGPVVAMIENHRTGLLWRLFMSCPEVRRGLAKLGFAGGGDGA